MNIGHASIYFADNVSQPLGDIRITPADDPVP
jgi:hypothetical protein